ncbi:hypothetical protein HAPAU_37110 [Halalkalicoccus paucihalophilus]|uniref:Uncharacterized protein n=1 Tax=Halalkalicoccus paucihalophilus TaxID=1008153 RepID=A0A151A9K6_9EURY|nr:hypothetical protein HAPAU_37110 [Halalkalicoccus paucihalophilus]
MDEAKNETQMVVQKLWWARSLDTSLLGLL